MFLFFYLKFVENEGTHNLKFLVNNFLYRLKSEMDEIYIYVKDFCDYTAAQLKDLSKSTNVKDALKMFFSFFKYEIFNL